jgi:outer membrane receptor protein involved in Fe transport
MQTKLRSLVSLLLLCAGTTGLFSPLLAQTVAPPPANAAGAPAARPVVPTTAPGDGVVQLSPFQVASDTDRGYQALNTLSGTRLNSKLEDLGSSISVVTMQQMLDTAVSDLNDVLLYEASTEGTGNFTQFTPNRNGGVGDNVSSDPARANRIRGVGSAGTSGSGVNVAFGNRAMNTKIPVDLYNIDAVEISRGPNSNLFGLGASAGTVNLVPSQANVNRATSSVALRFDDWGGHRESLNINRPIIPGKLAARVAAVHESKGFTRKPSSERIDRIYATITAQPFKNTVGRVSFENYHNFYRRPNSLMPRDTTVEWRAAGGPSWDPTTQMVTLGNGTRVGPFPQAQDATLPTGLMGGGNLSGRTLLYFDGATPQFFTTARTGNPITTGTPSPYTANSNVRYIETGTHLMRNKANLYPLFFQPAIKDKSLYDWESVNYIAPNYGLDEAKTWSAELEQTFLRNPEHLIVGRVGWFRQDFTRDSRFHIDSTDTVIFVDPNEKLLNGQPNPYFKRPYVQSVAPVSVRTPEISDTQTADLAYQFTPAKLPRWLSFIGQQRLGTHWETVRYDTTNFRQAQFISDDHAWTNRANRVAVPQIAQRYYVGDAVGQNLDYAPAAIENINGNYNLAWFNNLTGQHVSEPTRVDYLDIVGTTARREEIRTVNATLQSFFFKDRLVTTYGWRRDRRRERTSAGNVVDPATGVASYNNLNVWNRWTDDQGDVVRASQRGDTKTWGAVVKPLRWLNLHYNQSDSFAPQVVRQELDLVRNVPNPRGEGWDYGISFTALQGKLSVRLNRFEVTEYDSRGSEVGTIGNRTFRLEGRAENNGQRDPESLFLFAENMARGRFTAQGNTNPSQAQLRPAIAQIMNVTPDWLNIFLDSGLAQPQTVGTTDVQSRGYEIEATYNPTRNWRIKFTGSQAEALDLKVSPEIMNYFQSRLPTWTTIRNDQGQLWWTTVASNGQTPEAQYLNSLLSPYLVGVSNEGKPRTQVRKYRWATVTNYDFTEGRLKNFNFGGALRWEDKASIGFAGKPPATAGNFTGAILELDPDKPYWDKARFYVDLSAGYRFRLGDKIRAKAQLNIRDAFEDGRLQRVAVNPDGSTYAYRIINPRQFILSLAFDL